MARSAGLAGALAVLTWLACGASVRAEETWLEVSSPSEGETVRALGGIVELRGRVGSGAHRAYDVVVAVDQSQSTLLPTGLDLDRDGLLGALTLPDLGAEGVCGSKRWVPSERCRPFRRWTTDFDDAVVHAERTLARKLLADLEAQGARVALVSFSGKARAETSFGPASEVLAALGELPIRADWSGSNVGAAVQQGLRMLGKVEHAETRGRAVLLVTDGMPTAPVSDRVAAETARESAGSARAAEIPLYIFQIRSEEDVDTALLAEMAELAGGRRIYVDAPERLRFALPSPSFARVESVEIRNVTLERAARAPRVFPGGAFDAFVPLAPGENVLEIRARLPGDASLELRRTVYFEAPPSDHPSEQARMQALLDELRRRTLETEHAPRASDVDPDRRSVRVREAGQDETP
jgi:uncharacterized protein YegL